MLAEAFAQGCKRHGVACDLQKIGNSVRPERGVSCAWMYGLGEGMKPFRAYESIATRIIGDSGYFLPHMPTQRADSPGRYVRISVNAHQLGELTNRGAHPPDRFDALGIKIEPVTKRGDVILVTARSVADARKYGTTYGQWERDAVARIRAVSDRPIVVRAKPKNPPIDIPGTTRCRDEHCWQAIRKAWAVVHHSGNVGADCILHGVPSFAENGPGAVYFTHEVKDIESARPLSDGERAQALADIAYWQWSREEISGGALWAHLKAEGVV